MHSISMAAAAVRLASQLFEDLRETSMLFVGAGEMIELAATHFAARQPRLLAIANRSGERAEELGARFAAHAMPLADLPARLAEFDIVVSCTASSLPIIGLGAVERAMKARRHRPMFMLDLAVPRDIEPEVAHLSDVYLYTLDDLSALVQTAGEKRDAAVAQAEAIIETGVRSFVQWLDRRGSIPLIQALNAQADDWRSLEIARAKKLLAGGEDVAVVLDSLSKGLTQKMLHGTLAELRAAEGDERRAPGRYGVAPVPACPRARARRRQALAAGARSGDAPATPPPRPHSPEPMKASLRQQLERLALRLDELDATLADPGVAADMKRYRELSREHAEASELVGLFRRYQGRERDLASAAELRAESAATRPWPRSPTTRPRARAAPIWSACTDRCRRRFFRAIPTTCATSSSRSAPAPAATSRRCSPPTSPACTCATPNGAAGAAR